MENAGSSRIHGHRHAVQFCGSDNELLETVGTFLSEGFVSGHPAVVIATAPHRLAIEKALEHRMIDVERARSIGDLVLLDADDTLATFMIDGIPSAAVFKCGYAIGNFYKQTQQYEFRCQAREQDRVGTSNR